MRAQHAIRSAQRAIASVALILACGSAPAGVPADQVKAAFLYNFALFVEWPGDPGDTLELCLYGGGAFPAADALAGKRVGSAALRVQRPARAEALGGCHIVYIHSDDLALRGRATAALDDAAVLTVADMTHAGDRSAIISLAIEGGRIVFDIDNRAAQQRGLRISSRLLRLARKVY